MHSCSSAYNYNAYILFSQIHLTLELEMPKDVKLVNVPILGTIVHVLGSFAGVIGKTKDAEMR